MLYEHIKATYILERDILNIIVDSNSAEMTDTKSTQIMLHKHSPITDRVKLSSKYTDGSFCLF
jgi:hypothetical protein